MLFRAVRGPGSHLGFLRWYRRNVKTTYLPPSRVPVGHAALNLKFKSAPSVFDAFCSLSPQSRVSSPCGHVSIEAIFPKMGASQGRFLRRCDKEPSPFRKYPTLASRVPHPEHFDPTVYPPLEMGTGPEWQRWSSAGCPSNQVMHQGPFNALIWVPVDVSCHTNPMML